MDFDDVKIWLFVILVMIITVTGITFCIAFVTEHYEKQDAIACQALCSPRLVKSFGDKCECEKAE